MFYGTGHLGRYGDKTYKFLISLESMLDLSTCLSYYKNPAVQRAIVDASMNREIGVRFLKGHFGKRPQALFNPADVFEFAKQGASSFHVSEEHWTNPLSLNSTLSKKELEKLRIGWDLIIDVDCPDWDLSKRITAVIIKVLRQHGVQSVSCKFSGNKGFHVGVPFSAFPRVVLGKSASYLFPEGVKRILRYIAYYAEQYYSDEILAGLQLSELSQRLSLPKQELYRTVCAVCNKSVSVNSQKYDYFCTKCGHHTVSDSYEEYISCSKCSSIVRADVPTFRCPHKGCSSKTFARKVHFATLLGLDHVLISSRHLYRMPYSLHEKSGLVSVPINPDAVLQFEKEMAKPENIVCDREFLSSRAVQGEAGDFLQTALDFDYASVYTEEYQRPSQTESSRAMYAEEEVHEKIPEEFFPPSIKEILGGLKDGKKRALFVLVNFFVSVGWSYEDIEARLREWNAVNPEPLRENILKTHLHYHKTNKKKVLPPNYSNHAYYADLGVGTPEELQSKFKNPVVYAKYLFSQHKKNHSSRKKTVAKKSLHSSENKESQNVASSQKTPKASSKEA